MKTTLRLASIALLAALCFADETEPAKHELGLLLGAISSPERTLTSPAGKLTTSPDVALQANYGYRLYAGDRVAVYAEVHFLADALRDVSSNVARVSHDYASLYLTPGIRVKFAPRSRFSPYAAVGGGYALYEQSLFTQDQTTPNGAPRFRHRGAFDAAGGADYKFWRFVSLRGEFRYFYTGNPDFNAVASNSGQHNLVGSGGIVLRWGK
ncbi:MAG: outer membrane beta-barrel protein [Bryobacteraceae bacterium]